MKKAVSLLLAFILALTLCSCGTKTAPAASSANNTVTDGSGAVLAIPENNTETAIASVYAVSVPFIVALGLSDRVKAINVKSKFWTDNVEALGKAGSVGRGVVDLEALAKLAPVVLIHRSNDPKTVEAVKALGIDVLCVKAENLDDIKSTLLLMGKYFGVSARADEVCKWMDTKFAYIDSIVQTLLEDKRVTALVMGGELSRVAGGDMLQSWMIEKAGGKCVADGVGKDHNWLDVGVETIFEWNPDFLFCTGSTALNYSVDGLYKDTSWSSVNAVKNGKVFRIPATSDAWDMPGISCVIGTMYMLHEMYPDYFSAEELQAQIDDYYTFMFGKTFDASYLGYDLEN
ncbi:MAG: ABC transporter substrate-binding protein [Oscillospiraceae bacterium]